jgi:hypothetical protein
MRTTYSFGWQTIDVDQISTLHYADRALKTHFGRFGVQTAAGVLGGLAVTGSSSNKKTSLMWTRQRTFTNVTSITWNLVSVDGVADSVIEDPSDQTGRSFFLINKTEKKNYHLRVRESATHGEVDTCCSEPVTDEAMRTRTARLVWQKNSSVK